jgi:RHS repeat-associated protein
VEVDENADVISYEEYHPYGTTAYQSGPNSAEVTLKRYRYTGMERDEESGLSYHVARYYAPWLCRWAAVDPSAASDGLNLYAYVNGRPVNLLDVTGSAGDDSWAAAKEGLAWEKYLLGEIEKKVPTVRQVTVKASIKGRMVESVLDGLSMTENGLEAIESKLNPTTKLRKAQQDVLDHIHSGGSFEISATRPEKLKELSTKLHVSPNSPLKSAAYHVVNRGNVNEKLQAFKVIGPDDLMVLVKDGKFIKATKDEMLAVEKILQGKTGYVEDTLKAVRAAAHKAKEEVEAAKKAANAMKVESKAASTVQHASEGVSAGNKLNEYGSAESEAIGASGEAKKLMASGAGAWDEANRQVGRGPDAGVPAPSVTPRVPKGSAPRPEPGFLDWLLGGSDDAPDAGSLNDAMRRANQKFIREQPRF